MDDQTGMTPPPDQPPVEPVAAPPAPPAPDAPVPPPVTYAPPAAPPPAAPPAAAYTAPVPAAAPYQAPAAPPKKKKVWLWVLLGLVGLGLIGCILGVVGIGALGGVFGDLFGSDSPSGAIEAVNQAAIDGDRATYEKHFDADSVVELAYPAFLEYLKTTAEYTDLVGQIGEEAADAMLAEEIMPKDQFVTELTEVFDIDALGDGEVPFPQYTIGNTSIEDNTAEVTLTTVEEGENVEYVLRLEKEEYEGESVWRIKEILNIAELLASM